MPLTTNPLKPIPASAAGQSPQQLIAAINDRLRTIGLLIGQQANSSVLYGTHIARMAALPANNKGRLWIEVDRGYVTYFSDGVNWHFASGMWPGGWNQRPVALGVFDAGFQFFVSVPVGTTYPFHGVTEMWSGSGWLYLSGEMQMAYSQITNMTSLLSPWEANLLIAESTYKHRYQWNGNEFHFAAGDQSQYFIEADMEPQGGVWYPCDGNSHLCSNDDGVSQRNVPTQKRNDSGTVAGVMTGGFIQAINAATPETYFSAGSGNVLKSGTDLQPNPPSVANGGLPQYYTGSWWLRA